MITVLWIQLVGAALVIFVASNFLAKSADVISLKTGLGRAFVGVVLLATATSLPELATGISAITVVNEPDLALGDAFGSNLFNLLIIGLLDIYWREGPILRSIGSASILVGVLGIVVISFAGTAVIMHGLVSTFENWYVSPMSVVLFGLFLVSMYMIYRNERTVSKDTVDLTEHQKYVSASIGRAVVTYIVAALLVVGAGIWLAILGDHIADEMGWQASFVGTQFLALSTSLPELATSFSAIRLRAPELAITNLLGSNLFNMGFVLFADDLVYQNGVVWAHVSWIHGVTALIAVLMTSVVIVSLVYYMRNESGKSWKITVAPVLIGCYVLSSLLAFYMG